MTVSRKASDDEITQAITVGITFKGAKLKRLQQKQKLKLKQRRKPTLLVYMVLELLKRKQKSDKDVPIVIRNKLVLVCYLLIT